MQEHIDAMGHKYKDLITGYEGVCESISVDLYGCVQYLLRPAQVYVKDGDLKVSTANWFDYTRLKKLSKNRVMEIPALFKIKKQEPQRSDHFAGGIHDKPSK